jgi:hypothetical protein
VVVPTTVVDAVEPLVCVLAAVEEKVMLVEFVAIVDEAST